MRKRNNKKLNLFGLVNDSASDTFLTITTTVNEAADYAARLMRLKHNLHYKNWCDAQQKVDDKLTWGEYYNECITPEEKLEFKILKIPYTSAQIAAVMRMFIGVLPLGCDYDSPIEYDYVASKAKDNELDEDILNMLEESLDFNPRFKDFMDSIKRQDEVVDAE